MPSFQKLSKSSGEMQEANRGKKNITVFSSARPTACQTKLKDQVKLDGKFKLNKR